MSLAQLSLVWTPEDRKRSREQYERVKAVLLLGGWWTLRQIQAEIQKRFNKYDPEPSISARWRELRRDGWPCERRLAENGNGLRIYRIVTAEAGEEREARQ